MKLISLYIENFGGLHRYELDFQQNLTVIEEANGFGKTTLAEFIRAMFYGFPRKAKTLDKSRRQKYTPWNGGKFGGNLVFELDGVRYRVERSFGATPKGDSFTLIDLDTGKKSSRFTEELGLELFQLDADSFERSTYLPQMAEGQMMTTDSIRSKLSNLVEDTNDVGNFEKAMAALRAKRSTYVPYRGSGGSVAQAGSRISVLQDQLSRTEGQKKELEDTERSIGQLQQAQETAQNRRDQLRGRIRLASEAAAARAVHGQHRHLTGQYEAAVEACRKLEEKYPNGIPTFEQIEQARNGAARLEILNSQTVTEQDDLDAAAYLEENRSRFENRVPTEEELTECRSWCRKHAELGRDTMELAERLTRQSPVKVNPLPLVLLLLIAVGTAVPGIVFFRSEVILSYIAMGIGAAALIGSMVAAARLTAARKKQAQFHQEQAGIRKEMDGLSAQAEQLADRIGAFLSGFGMTGDGDFFGLLAELEHSSEDYLRAQARVTQWRQEKDRHEAQLAQWNGVLTGFFEENGLIRQADVRNQLLQIRDDRKDWEEAAEDAKRLGRELDAFRQEQGKTLAVPVPDAPADLEQLHREETDWSLRLNTYAEELIRKQQRKEQLLSQVQQIPQLQEELEQWQEKKAADQSSSDLLDATMDLLEQAKENLSVSYLGPLRQSFAHYLGKLWQDQEGQVLVTPDLQVQLERFGAARELGYFSAGQADTVMLCMRLALVDALFREEKPFVILDDPFVNLDDGHTAEALDLLKALAQDRQIIYLTCNSSRIPQ